MGIDSPGGRFRKAEGIDKAVVVQGVTHHQGLRGDKLGQNAHDRSVGGTEDHGRLTPVEGGQTLFQLDVGFKGAADEANGPGACAETPRCFLFRLNHPEVKVEAKIGIGVHAQ